MARRLFEQAFVLPSGGAGAWPASAVLHAGIAAVLLVVPTLGPLAIPEPPTRRIDAFPSLAAIVPVQRMPAMPPRGSAPRSGHGGPSLRPAASIALPPAAPLPVDEPAGLPDSESEGLVNDALVGLGSAGDGRPGDAGIGTSTGDPGTGPVLVRAVSLLEQPTKLRHVQPIYPELALHAHVQGVVILECILDPSGHVADVKVLKGHPLLDDAARTAVRQWFYAPTRLNNVPVSVLLTVTVQFRIPR